MDVFDKLRTMKILLIDDDEWIRDSLSIFFEAEGCQLMVFETAEEGLAELKDQTYDLIIVDYKLPGLDGLEFLKRTQNAQSESRCMSTGNIGEFMNNTEFYQPRVYVYVYGIDHFRWKGSPSFLHRD
jgi:DNA-binding NtrC family response regulator